MEKNNQIELPKGWIWTNIESITRNHDGKRIPINSTEREKISGSYPYYGASGIIDHVNDFLFDGTYLLIGEDGANLLSRSTPIAFLASGKFWVNNHAHVLTTYCDMPLNFISLYINSINLSKWVTGTAQPKLNQRKLNSIPIPLSPLNEQKRIVSKIEELFSEIDNIELMIKKIAVQLSQYKESILMHAFAGKLTETWRKKFNISTKWAQKDLGSLTINSKNGYTGRPKDEPPGMPRLGIISVSNSENLYVDEEKYRYIEISSSEAEQYLLKKNDLLVCRQNGNKHYVGKFAVYSEKNKPVIFSDSLIRFRVNEIEILPEYLTAFMNSKIGRKLIDPYCSTTAGNYSINSTSLKQIVIDLPILEEQRIIVAMIEEALVVIQLNKKIIESFFKKINGLRQSILKMTFEGKLVPQDPKDESASILLEKIKQQKNSIKKDQMISI